MTDVFNMAWMYSSLHCFILSVVQNTPSVSAEKISTLCSLIHHGRKVLQMALVDSWMWSKSRCNCLCQTRLWLLLQTMIKYSKPFITITNHRNLWQIQKTWDNCDCNVCVYATIHNICSRHLLCNSLLGFCFRWLWINCDTSSDKPLTIPCLTLPNGLIQQCFTLFALCY